MNQWRPKYRDATNADGRDYLIWANRALNTPVLLIDLHI